MATVIERKYERLERKRAVTQDIIIDKTELIFDIQSELNKIGIEIIDGKAREIVRIKMPVSGGHTEFDTANLDFKAVMKLAYFCDAKRTNALVRKYSDYRTFKSFIKHQ